MHLTKRSITASLAVTAAIGLALSGCSLSSSNAPVAGASSAGCKGTTMAYLTPGISVPYWRSLSVGIQQAAKPSGVKVTTYDSNNSQSKQLQNAQDAITAGVSAIIISPTDSASAPAVLALAAKSKVPVVIADIGTDSGDYVTFVKTDNLAGAAAAGAYLAKRLTAAGFTNSPIGIIGISQARQNGKDRTKGFTDAVTKDGNTILPLLEAKDYSRAEGLAFAQDLITANPTMHGFFSEHDEATQGALTAVATAGKQKDIIMVGFDGSPETFKAIQDGRLAGAAMQQPVLMGADAFKSACAFLDGKPTKKLIVLPTIMVTSDNVNQIGAEVKANVFASQ